MNFITIDEKDKKRIQKHIKQAVELYNCDKDIEILEQENQLTEKLAEELLEDLMRKCQSVRGILEPKGEFEKEIINIFEKFDKIPKPENYEQYGYYNGAYRDMELDEIYANIQTCMEFKEIDDIHYESINIRTIADSTINSINGIERLKIQIDQNTKNELEAIKKEIETLLSSQKTDISSIKERVEKYNEYAIEIWNSYLSNVENGKENNFRYLVHNLAKGEIQGDFRTKYISTSLITDKTMGVFGNGSKYGLILKPKHIISADYKDTYTNNYRQDEEELFNIKPPIKLPQEIEEICINQTIEANGEMLNYDKGSIYSEIVVDEYEVVGIYYISNGEKELSPNYGTAKKMAEERGIPLKELDIGRCRTDKGLELMTEKKQKDFCRNILRKYCLGNNQMEEKFHKNGAIFVENHYKEFYEKYKKLKQNGEYTKDDILKELKVIALDEDVKRWEKFDFYHPGFFTGELSTEDLQYIIDSRFDFNKCKNYEEFERLYNIFCNTLEGRFVDERMEEYVNERFINKEEILLMKDKKLQLQKIFESGEITLESVLEQIGKEKHIETDKIEQKDELLEIKKETKIVENNEELQEEKTMIEEYSINQYGEILRPENNQKTEDIKVQKDSVEEVKDTKKVLSKELTEPQKINLWMNRFKQYESSIDRVSQNAKLKFIKMKSDIMKAISDKIKGRDNKQKIENNNKTKGGRSF